MKVTHRQKETIGWRRADTWHRPTLSCGGGINRSVRESISRSLRSRAPSYTVTTAAPTDDEQSRSNWKWMHKVGAPLHQSPPAVYPFHCADRSSFRQKSLFEVRPVFCTVTPKTVAAAAAAAAAATACSGACSCTRRDQNMWPVRPRRLK